jgi:hypothetical protein
VRAALEHLLEAAVALTRVAANAPEVHERGGEAELELGLAGFGEPGERRAEVVVLRVEPCVDGRLVSASQTFSFAAAASEAK